ncbi:MAG TPA: thiolase family protein [Chloroflexota bacterium]|jgi:3-oxoadipyl-CoA thiolase|nr:thiolase family protein [Chloroflexota bacterium]
MAAREAVIVAAVRTPIGRYAGALKSVRPDDLAGLVVAEVVRRSGIAPELVEDVVLGCANQAGEDNRNVARMAVLLGGLPQSVAGQTVNRLCGSGLQAVNTAAQMILTEMADVVVAGGVESMTRAPFVLPKPEEAFPRGNLQLEGTTLGWRLVNPRLQAIACTLGETAENVAAKWGVSREEQDEFALGSQQKAAAAIREGRFHDEIVPVPVPQRRGEPVLFAVDEHPRPDTTLEALAKLPPAFRKGGTVTAGNSSGLNDGAAALLLMSAQRAAELGLRPLARYVQSAVVGVDPLYMGIGPIPATRRLLQRTGLRPDDLDLIELNEAFAAQAIPCIRELELDPARVNVNGGAIALGHPLGCTGARLVTTLVHEMRRRQARYGLVTMCIGVGQGIATLFERVA